MYLLDTNTCIAYLNKSSENIIHKFRILSSQDIKLCDIVQMELLYGAYKSVKVKENLELLDDFFQKLESLPFDSSAARYCGQIRAFLAKTGKPIGPYDCQIAAIALANDLTLVTHNVREFSRVENLNIEDWQAI